MSIDTLIKRLEAIYEVYSGVAVTCENCEEAPTVKAVMTAITRRFGVMPVHVYATSMRNGRAIKEIQPSHPVERLLSRPNDWQDKTNYWLDASSRLARYGNFYTLKGRGVTGPVRKLFPLPVSAVEPKQDDEYNVTYRVHGTGGRIIDYPAAQIHHVRMSARDALKGDSPVMDVRESIGLEMAAEKMGASFFGNGGLPGMVFEYAEGSQGFKTDEERRAFLDEFQERFTARGRFRAIIPPKGVKLGQQIPVENEKAQFLETRQYQRTVIAGAWGVPPHLVADLSKGTFNNVEMQGIEFTTNVILPLCRMFESAMERDLLTDEDRRSGIIIRFNPDAVLRGDFKTRQEGLAMQRQNGVINANEWREREGMNPISDEDGGEEYFRQGPSGQTAEPSSSPSSEDKNERET